MTPERNRTDERLDALANRMDEGFREVRAELKAETSALRGEMGTLRGEMGTLRAQTVEVHKEIGVVREGLGEVKAEIKGINRTVQVGFGLTGAVLAGILGLIAAQL
jgi:chromosome segregation ATPase